MARHGENIRRRQDGRWEGRYAVYHKEKGKRIYHSVYGRSYNEVKDKLNIQKNLAAAQIEEGKIKFSGAEPKQGAESLINTVPKGGMKEGGVKEENAMTGSSRTEQQVWMEKQTGMNNQVKMNHMAEEYPGLGEFTVKKMLSEKTRSEQPFPTVQQPMQERQSGQRQPLMGEHSTSGQPSFQEDSAAGQLAFQEQEATRLLLEQQAVGKPIGKGLSLLEMKDGHALTSVRGILFSDVAAQWLLTVEVSKKQSTYVKYRLLCHNHLEKIFKDHTIADFADHQIRAELTDSLSKACLANNLSDSSWKSIYCVLNQILNHASIQYSIIVPEIKKPASNARNKPVEVFTRKEQKRLIPILYHRIDRYKMAVLLCLHTGLRLGEVCALKWEDIDTEGKMLAIHRTVQRLYVSGYETKTILLETEPKSVYSKREIPLSISLLKQLFQLSHDREEEYIFGRKKPVEPKTMQNHFKRHLKAAGLSDKNFHILRHTFATNCVEGGVDVRSLSEILGHSDVQITLNRYVHPSMDTKRKYLDTLTDFYGQICGQDMD